MKRTWVGVVAASIAALLLAGCDSEAKIDTTSQESWLFSLQSAGTTDFDQSSSVLSVPVGSVVGFSDRPYRVVQDLAPTKFAALWADTSKNSFRADPPNAALTYWDSEATDAVAHTVIVVVTENVVAGNVLSMTLQIVSPSGAVLPAKMYRASLFVDSYVNGTFVPWWIAAECPAATQAWYNFQNTGEGGNPTDLYNAYYVDCAAQAEEEGPNPAP